MHIWLVRLAARNTPLVLAQFSRAASPHIARFGDVLPCRFQSSLNAASRERLSSLGARDGGRRVSDAGKSSPKISFTDPECLPGRPPGTKKQRPQRGLAGVLYARYTARALAAREIKTVLAGHLPATLVELSYPLWSSDPEFEQMTVDYRRGVSAARPLIHARHSIPARS